MTAVTACVDVRHLDARFGAMLIQLARTADAVLVRGDGLVAEPQVAAYTAALRSSEAWRFSDDPPLHSLRDAFDAEDDAD